MSKFYRYVFSSVFVFTLALSYGLVQAGGPTTNPPPTAYAGPDQTITLPTSSVTLSGSGTAGVVSYTWDVVSGSGNIVSRGSQTTQVTNLTAGTSIFRLTVTDSFGQIGTDDVSIIVNSGGMGGTGGATAYAGPDQTLPALTTRTTVSGSSTGISGFVIYYSWTKLSGSGTIVSPTQATTDITNLDVGSSTFRFTATNNTGETAFDDVDIVVLPAGPQPTNMPPTAYAGPDQILTSPASSTTLSGSGVDSDGTIASYNWTKISGSGFISPGTGSSNGSVVAITGLTVGTSVFRLTVTDNLGATGYDDLNVVVNPAGTGGGGTGGGGTGGTGGGSGSGGTSVGKSIILNGNITYSAKDGTDVLGLIAEQNILIPKNSPTNLEVDAALLAQNGATKRYYYPGDTKNSLFIYGSIITNKTWTWSWVSGGGAVISGYENTNATYDTNLTYGPPPGFPVGSEYNLLSWEVEK
jgi:hypothetical protein